MLEVLFPLDRRSDIFMMLSVNETLQTVAPGETEDYPDTVLPCSTRQVAGNTDVKSAVRPVRYDVNPSSLHRMIVRMKMPECNRGADGRVKPGHDGKGV